MKYSFQSSGLLHRFHRPYVEALCSTLSIELSNHVLSLCGSVCSCLRADAGSVPRRFHTNFNEKLSLVEKLSDGFLSTTAM